MVEKRLVDANFVHHLMEHQPLLLSRKPTSHFQDFKSFSKIYWLLCACSVLMYTNILSFNAVASSYIIEKWYTNESLSNSSINAGSQLTILWIVSAVIGSPVLGSAVDKYGFRSILNMISAICAIMGHLLMIFIYPTFPLMLLGLAYCTNYAAIWASIAYVTHAKAIGKAYGTVISLQNLGLFISPLIVAFLRVHYDTYDAVFNIGESKRSNCTVW